MFENIRIALTNLGANKLRTALTMLGTTIGVAAVIILVSVGQAFEDFVRAQFEGIGANLVFVVGGADDRGNITPMTQTDVEAISDPFRVPDAALILPQDNFTRSIRFENREITTTIRAVTADYLDGFARDVVAGRFFDRGDMDSAARVVVIDPGLVDPLFGDRFPVGQNVRIDDVRFTVIGILDDTGSSFGPPNGVSIPLTTAQTRLRGTRVLSGERTVDFIAVQARNADSVDAVAAQITQALREAREISFRDEDNFVVFTQTEVLDTLGSITGLITVFLALLAGISLIVGGIGIMNIMLVTVTERTREIGLRKAVGAQKSDILLQFLIEAVILSLAGGAVGVLIAFGSALLVTGLIRDLTVTVRPESVLLATAISILVGVLSGSYPANRAGNLNPIDALRYE